MLNFDDLYRLLIRQISGLREEKEQEASCYRRLLMSTCYPMPIFKSQRVVDCVRRRYLAIPTFASISRHQPGSLVDAFWTPEVVMPGNAKLAAAFSGAMTASGIGSQHGSAQCKGGGR